MSLYYQIGTVAVSMFKDCFSYTNKMEGSKDIISKLKFIGCLKTGEKINTRHMYVQSDGIGTKISRTFLYQDNRNNALCFVHEAIMRSFELLSRLERSEKESDKLLCNNLVRDLRQAKKGLVHLKETYLGDTKFKCDMDTLLEDIEVKLKDIDKRYVPTEDDNNMYKDSLS